MSCGIVARDAISVVERRMHDRSAVECPQAKSPGAFAAGPRTADEPRKK